jgi:hypothetical protein
MLSHHCRRKPAPECTKNSFDRQTCVRDETENLKRPYKLIGEMPLTVTRGLRTNGSRVKLGWCITNCVIWGEGEGKGVRLFESLAPLPHHQSIVLTRIDTSKPEASIMPDTTVNI